VRFLRRTILSADSVTFHHVSPDAYRGVRERLLTTLEGTQPEGEPDVIEFHGIRGTLSYDERAQAVTATFHQVPPVVSRGYVTGWLHDALDHASR
jgi:hypothetical protein